MFPTWWARITLFSLEKLFYMPLRISTEAGATDDVRPGTIQDEEAREKTGQYEHGPMLLVESRLIAYDWLQTMVYIW